MLKIYSLYFYSMLLALDVATSCGVCYNVRKKLYIGTVVGVPSEQYIWVKENTKFNEVVIEELVSYNSRQPKILVNLAQRVGYLYHRFVEENIPVRWAHPGSWRKNLSLIQSKAGTRQLQISLKETFKVALSLDEVDAVGVWLFGMQLNVADIESYKIVKLGINRV